MAYIRKLKGKYKVEIVKKGFPIAIVGATVGYLGIKVIKYKRKLNQIKKEEKSKKKLVVKTASYAAIIITGIVIVFYLL